MLRRQLIAGLLAACWGTSGRAHAGDDQDPEPFVRALYGKLVRQHIERKAESEREFLAHFTPETRDVWLAMTAAIRQGRAKYDDKFPVGRILNAFFGWGVLPGHEIELLSINNHKGPRVTVVVVELAANGNPRTVYVHPVRHNGGWLISDINYGDGESFVGYCRRRAGL